MGYDVKEMRERTGLSQSRFASLYDIPLKTLQQWEQGVHRPPGYVLILLDKALRVDERYISGSAYLRKLVRTENDEESFIFFRSNIQHLIKNNRYDTVSSILSTRIIPCFFEKGYYVKALYLLSCLDTICEEEGLPLCADYDKYRSIRLKSPLVLCEDTDDSLPVFVKHNIYERSMCDVF